MQGVLYTSRAIWKPKSCDLSALAASSAVRNRELRVSGFLVFMDGNFLQYLEGEAGVVKRLMRRIRSDSRHRVEASLASDCLSRRFPSWSMRWIRSRDLGGVERELRSQLLEASDSGSDADPLHRGVWSDLDRVASVQHLLSQRSG